MAQSCASLINLTYQEFPACSEAPPICELRRIASLLLWLWAARNNCNYKCDIKGSRILILLARNGKIVLPSLRSNSHEAGWRGT